MKVTSTRAHGTHRLKFLIYGAPGVGKTTLAATLDEPCLVLSAEAGLLSLSTKDIDVIDLTLDDDGKALARGARTQRVAQVLDYLLTEEPQKKYKWIFIDSLTEISQNMIESLQLLYPDPKDGLKMWGDYAKKSRALVKSFRDLDCYNVVFTALDVQSRPHRLSQLAVRIRDDLLERLL